jgi:hypothetical protein
LLYSKLKLSVLQNTPDRLTIAGTESAAIESEVYGSTDQSRCVLDTLQLDPA